jgi:hypothetical protein
MRLRSTKSVTLIEMVITLLLISILAIVFAAIELMGVSRLLAVDRRSKVQNDLVYILEHSTKQISKAIGNTQINTAAGDEVVETIDKIDINDGASIRFYVDSNEDGVRNDTTPWRAYRFNATGGEYQLWYCSNCPNYACASCSSDAWGTKILSSKITNANYTYSSVNNYVNITIEGCWDPNPANVTKFGNCGSSNNPSASMKARIKMPAVSTR